MTGAAQPRVPAAAAAAAAALLPARTVVDSVEWGPHIGLSLGKGILRSRSGFGPHDFGVYRAGDERREEDFDSARKKQDNGNSLHLHFFDNT